MSDLVVMIFDPKFELFDCIVGGSAVGGLWEWVCLLKNGRKCIQSYEKHYIIHK